MSTAPTHDPAEAARRRRAARQAAAEALLAAPPPVEGLGGAARVLEGHVLRPSRSRPVVRWTVLVDEGSGAVRPVRVIGKGYLKGGAAEAAALLAALRDGGLDGPRLRVPQPYGHDPGRALLAQEEAPPTTLHDLIDDPGAAGVQAAARTGEWLAALHRVPVAGLPPLPADFEHRALTAYADRLAADVPAIGARVRDLVARTLAAMPLGAPLVTTHGDFQPKNVHLDDDSVVVIDFDRAAAAPAARDLGHFVAQTLTMGASRHGGLDALRPWAEAFLDGYLAAGGDPVAVAATPAYVSRTFAEVLFYRLVVRPVPDTGFVPAWLDAWDDGLGAAGAATGGGAGR